MRFKFPLFALSLGAALGACSDDGPKYPPVAHDYVIQSAQPAISVLQDSSLALDLIVTRDGEQLKWPGAATVDITNGTGRARFDPDTAHISMGGTVTWRNISSGNRRVDFRNTPGAVGDIPAPLPTNPPCVGCPPPTFPPGTDSSRIFANASGTFLTNIDTLYFYLNCTSTATSCPSNSADTGWVRVHQSPRLAYTSDDYSIAAVSSIGVVTGVNAGNTIIRVSGSGTVLEIPVEVRPRPATRIELTFVDPLDDNARLTEDTIYAYPADRSSSRLRAVVFSGDDTVFCNRCRNFQRRTQRYVTFSSSDPTRLLVSNTANPLLRPDTTGLMTTFDTTRGSNAVEARITTVDGLSASVRVHIKLRPIDSLEIRLDSLLDPTDPDDKIAYPSMRITLSDPVVGLGVTFRSKVYTPQDPNAPPGANNPNPRWIQVSETGTGRRSTLPIVSWETANINFAEVTSTGIVTGLRADAPRSSNTTTPNNSDCLGGTSMNSPGSPENFLKCVLTCSYQKPTPTVAVPDPLTGRIRSEYNGPPLPPDTTIITGTTSNPISTLHPRWGEPRASGDTTAWRLAMQEAMYTIPNCLPADNYTFRMPGVLCTGVAPASGQPVDLTSFCQVWIRARANDPASGKLLEDYAAITIRR